MTDIKIRVANASFINSIPYRALLASNKISYQENLPVACHKLLQSGQVDAALIAAGEYLKEPNYIRLPYGIACDGAVWSVSVYSECPIQELSSILLDSNSRSSVLLLKILLENHFKLSPTSLQFKQTDPQEISQLIEKKVGGLLIGDEALRQKGRFKFEYDLGSVWKEFSGLPFVFARWCIRKNVFTAELEELLLSLLDKAYVGRANYINNNPISIPDISPQMTKEYLLTKICYKLVEDFDNGEILFVKFI
jgi:chorismate dehydratase